MLLLHTAYMDFLLSKRMCVSHKVQLHAAADFICVQMFTESGRDVSVQPEEQGLWEYQHCQMCHLFLSEHCLIHLISRIGYSFLMPHTLIMGHPVKI